MITALAADWDIFTSKRGISPDFLHFTKDLRRAVFRGPAPPVWVELPATTRSDLEEIRRAIGGEMCIKNLEKQ